MQKSKNHLRESNAQLTHLSITDRLTQLYNRGHWEEVAEVMNLIRYQAVTPANDASDV
ncbi:hypothetical protein [Photobacterium leiognathi]|uniref:hypothetical protein n=1 Tax=Photobacterium leiognathi TaxID=553611 RepID=UPI0027366336|nr:hypothetical protein [Photobacterium leiognathi]